MTAAHPAQTAQATQARQASETTQWTSDEMMSVAAARALVGATTCFVGIGLPSTAANLARHVHEPGLVLVYESGTIGSKPDVLPLSIGDGELADTADAVVSVPEIFNYWLQAGRCDVGFLGGAQVDRFGNINTTTIDRGQGKPELRLPGAGGAPEIAAHSGRVLITARHSTRVFVERLWFVTTVGHGSGAGDRERLGLRGAGPTVVITDLGILEPDPDTRELTLVAVHDGVTVEQARKATGWDLRVADDVRTTSPPTAEELRVLRELKERTARAHSAEHARQGDRTKEAKSAGS
jgi:glutaconate CoA-transferase, subunit B